MITLVLGGARSGKSEFAERLAAGSAAGGVGVTYVATAVVAGDADFDARVLRHRARRPATWRTDEPGADLVGYLRHEPDPVATLLIDSLGTWVAAAPGFAVDAPALCRALAGREGDVIVVSEEVGLGVHPSTAAGSRFRDVLGEVNQAVAAAAGPVYLVVAGRPMLLPASYETPLGST